METTTGVLAEPLPPPEPAPPRHDLTPRQWVRANLASTPLNAAVTVVAGLAAAWVVYRLGRWVFVTDAWFFKEGDAAKFETARYGEFRILPNGSALLVGMADEHLQPLR